MGLHLDGGGAPDADHERHECGENPSQPKPSSVDRFHDLPPQLVLSLFVLLSCAPFCPINLTVAFGFVLQRFALLMSSPFWPPSSSSTKEETGASGTVLKRARRPAFFAVSIF